jgi:ADP-ribosylglycohydrolase
VIRDYIEEQFGYDLQRTCDEIRPDYGFDVSCQGSCPEAIIAFLDSSNFEDAIRLAVSLGGDADTIGAMTGGIAAAYYGVPDKIARTALGYLPEEMVEVLARFKSKVDNE